ncbi:MAG: AMP-binding protein [Thermoanaerobaculia bacterium]|nr:AMP-binding protein [Thermoanaerobaculia bacterium]
MTAPDATVAAVLDRTAAAHPDLPALVHKTDGEWQARTWSDYRDEARRVARGFLSLGLEPGKGVAILGFNRPQWFLADIGAILAGAVPTGIYTSSSPEQARYIVEHAEAEILVIESARYLELAGQIRYHSPDLKAVVLMEGRDPGALSWQKLLAKAEETPEHVLEARIEAQRPDDPCTLIYTSGTTGPPKAVMLSHRNLTWTADTVVDLFDFDPDDCVISYLPLSHIAEQVVSLHAPMAIGATTWFAESLEAMGENLREVRPHVFFGVPRVYEKMQSLLEEALADASLLRRALLGWARRIGLAAGYAAQRGDELPRSYPLFERLVFHPLRRRLGLDRARICAVGAARTTLETHEFFLSLGIPLLEVYGQSEDTGPATVSTPDSFRTGWCGTALPGTEVEIADDGEILVRGPHVFLGYLKDEEATRQAIDEEGWLHTGDIGELDEDGFLRVTDRKKEIFVTSGGKNISPQNIESLLKSIPAVGQVAAIGDGRKYITALLTLHPQRWRRIAKSLGSSAETLEEAAICDIIRTHVEHQVERVNERLSRVEAIKRFRILPREFSVEAGELTPTMKLKRRVIEENFAAEIERLYADA